MLNLNLDIPKQFSNYITFLYFLVNPHYDV